MKQRSLSAVSALVYPYVINVSKTFLKTLFIAVFLLSFQISAHAQTPAIVGTSATAQPVTDKATVSPFGGVSITDADVNRVELVTVTLDDNTKGTFTTLSGFAFGSGVYTFSGKPAEATTALQGLVFTPTANHVNLGSTEITTFTISVDSGGGGAVANDAATNVESTPVNDAPVIGGTTALQPVNDNATISPFSAVTITDPDIVAQTQTVTVTLDNNAKGSFTTLSGFTFGSGTYTFTGIASAAQTAIQGLVFTPTANHVNLGSTETTTFTIAVSDGVVVSPVTDAVTTVVSTAVNDAPVIGGTTALQPVNDNATISPFSAVTITDPDIVAQTQTVTVTLDNNAKGSFTTLSGFTFGSGTYTFTGIASAAQTAIQGLVFTPTANHVNLGSTETTTFTIAVSDGVVVSPVTDAVTTVVSTAVNDAPVIGGTTALQPVNDNATISPFSAVTITDPDIVAQTQTVTVTLDNNAKGSFTTLSGFTFGSGTYTFTGIASAAQTAIQGLVFTPTANHVNLGSTETTTFTIAVSDGVVVSPVTDAVTTVVSTAVNDAPVIGGTTALQPVNDNATISPFSAVTITDPDIAAQTQTVTVTLDNNAKGSFTTLSGFTFGSGTYTFTGIASAAQTAIQGLVFTPTANHVNLGSTETTTFTIAVSDGVVVSPVSNAVTTVVSTAVNDAPVIAGAVASQAVNDNATISPFSAVTITDPDIAAQTQTVTVTLDNNAKGSFTTLSGFTFGSGTYTFTGIASAAQTAIQGLVFTPTANHVNLGSTETTTFTIAVSDGVVVSPVSNAVTTVVSTAVNDAPVIAGAVASQAVNDNATISPFSAVTITDPDIAAQTQTVTVTLDNNAKGSFTTLSGFTFGSGTYTFTGIASAAQTAIQGLVFTPTANHVNLGSTETTTFTIAVSDGVVVSPVSNAVTTVVSTAVNDAPVIAGAVASQAVNDNATISPFSAVTITDPDIAAQTQTVTVTLDNNAKGSFTTLSGFTFGSGTYTFTGIASAAQTAIQGLVFTPTANHVNLGSTETTTFTIAVSDGVVVSPVSNAVTTVVSTAVNDAPVIAGAVASQAVNDNATISPFSAVTITDPDIAAQTQTVTVTLDNNAKGSFTTLSGFTFGSGTYTFTGIASAAQTAIQGLVFTPTANHVNLGSTETTTFTIAVSDGVVVSPVSNAVTTVVSTAVNDAPVIAGAVASQAVNDNATISPFSAVTITDPDIAAQTQTVTVTLDNNAKGSFTTLSGFTFGSGTYTFTGIASAAQTAIQGLVFTPTANHVNLGSTETTTFTIAVSDGVVVSPVSNAVTTVVSTAVNDAPVIAGAVASQAVNDNATISPFSAVTITDPDIAAQTQTVTVTLDNNAKGSFTTLSGFTFGSGTYTFTGIASAAQTAIQGLVFTPTANRVTPGSTETTTFTISVSDGVVVSPVTNNTTTVISTSVNDAPVIAGASAGQTVNDNATKAPFTAVTITDADSPAQTQSVSVTLDDNTKGSFTTLSGFTFGSGTYTFTGIASAAQTAIRGLVFTPTANRVNPGSTETTTFTISVSDGVVVSPVTNNTTTVISTSVNDAPVIAGAVASQAVNDNATKLLFSAVTVTDADSPAQTQTVIVTLDDATKGVFTPGSLTTSGFTAGSAGVYNFSGTAAATQTAIRLLVFAPTANHIAPTTTETTTFTISVSDGVVVSPVTNNTTTVISTSINNAPAIIGASAGQTVNDNTLIALFSPIVITDVDNPAQTQTVSVTLDDATKGIFTPGSLSTSGFTAGTAGVYNFSGTAAATQTAIRALIFAPTPNHVAPTLTETTTFTISVNDGAGAVTNSTTTVIATSINNAPAIAGAVAAQAVNDNATISPFAAITITDVDNPAQTQTVSVTLDLAAKGSFTTLSGFADAGSGVYTFSGTAAATQTAIRGLVFTPTNARVLPGNTETTTFTISVNDGIASAVTNSTTTVISTPVGNANLSSLTTTAGTITPGFAQGTITYTASVINATTSVTVTPTVADALATIQVRVNAGTYTTVTSGAASLAQALNVGTNPIDVKVTAQDGTTIRTYTITVTRAPSAVADLTSLTTTAGTIAPGFAGGTISYTASVTNATTSVTVIPTVADATATVQVRVNAGSYTTVTSGVASLGQSLNVGANPIDVKVTAQDGTTIKTYTITVTRAPSGVADLTSLTTTAGTIAPGFAGGTISYTASVTNATTSVTVTPTVADATATVQVRVNAGSYTTVTSGVASLGQSLNVGANPIDVKVTAQDGTTIKTYTITVTRAPSAVANLSTLTTTAGTIAPAFLAGTISYAVSVANATTSVTVTPTVAEVTATVQVRINAGTYTTVTSGVASLGQSLNVGANPIDVKVTAQDGTTIKTYTITVTRAPNTNANLSALATSTGTLSPNFAAATLAYEVKVPNATSTIAVTPTVDQANATVAVNGVAVTSGTASGNVTLAIGSNTVTVVSTAQDGTTSKSYTITVIRAGLPVLTVDPTSLTFTGTVGTVPPGSTTFFTVSGSDVIADVTATVAAPYQVSKDGIAAWSTSVTYGASSFPTSTTTQRVYVKFNPTTVGASNGTATVTTANGASKTVTLNGTGVSAISDNAALSSLRINNGTMSPTFVATTFAYTASVANSVSTVAVTPTTDNANATVKVNGVVVTSGLASADITLNVGANTITTTTLAQDGTTTKTYTITITRAGSAVATLSAMAISSGTLSPVFAATTTAYTATVTNSVSSITLTPAVEESNAKITVNQIAVTSGSASSSIALNTGSNTINVLVTAQDGTTTKSYTVTVTRSVALSTNANLSSLSLGTVTYGPVFSSTVTSYSATVPNATTSVTVSTKVDNAGAVAVVNGVPITGQTISTPVSLTVGTTNINIVVTAEDGTTKKTYIVKVARQEAQEVIPDAGGNVTVSTTTPQVIVSSPTQAVTVTIPIGTVNPSVDYGTLVTAGTGTIPQTTINSTVSKVEIPAATTVTASNPLWDGVINAPVITTYTPNPVDVPVGQVVTPSLVIEVGSPNISLSFSKAVRLLLPGQKGMRAAFIHAGVYTEITTVGSADTQVAGDALPTDGAFKIDVGNDLVIWTKAFSTFITFTQTTDLNVAIVAADKDALTADMIRGSNVDLDHITTVLTNPLPATAAGGSDITWASNNTSVVSSDGKTIARPIFGAGAATATLTATIKKGIITDTKAFTLTVLEQPNQAPTLAAIANTAFCFTTTGQTINLSGITAGPETGQTTTLTVTSNNSNLFNVLSVTPVTGGTATLSYSIKAGASGTATVTVTAKDNGGTANGGTDTFVRTFTVTVNPLPSIVINSSLGTDISKGFTTNLIVSGGVTYTWATAAGILSGQNTATLVVRPTVTTTYTVTATNATGCTSVQTFTVNVLDDYRALDAGNIMTPNGDGKNDALVIKNLDMYPNNLLTVFDRSGRVVYKKQNYTNDWTGTMNGAQLSEDTYFYILDFGNVKGQIKGFVSIVKSK